MGHDRKMYIPIASALEDRRLQDDLDAAKALFMSEVTRIVEEGHGELAMLESGRLELRLATGEIYYLGEQSITRIT